MANASPYADRFIYFTSIGFGREIGPGFGQAAAEQLEADVKAGAKGIQEIAKSFGITVKKADGSRLQLDDPELDPIWETAARLNIPVFIHTADPQKFWDPIDYTNERWLELALFRDRRYQDPAFPRFETLMAERDRLFKKHPKTKFVTAHLGWHANDLARLGRMFDEMPNVYSEIGAVLYDIGRQPRFAHDFFVKYQDRILFGKDNYQPDEYPYYWRVLETSDEYFDYYRDYHAFWKLYGIALPDDVLKKLYFENALKIIPGTVSIGFPAVTTTMPHYLVTGGAGFIGSHLCEELVRRGERVRVVDSLITGKRQNLAHLPQVEFMEGDLADIDVARRAVHGIDYVLHQAAIPSVPRSVEDPLTSNRANIDASLNLLVAARDASVKRVVYAGSSSAYGNSDAAQGRDDADGAAVAVCAAEAGGRAVLPDVHDALRARDGDDPLLQRVRAAAGSLVAVLGRDLALHQRAVRRTPADDLRRRRADARLHLRRQRRRRRAARVPRAGGERGSDQRRDRRPHLAEPAVRDREREVGSSLEPIYSDPRAGDVRDSQADIGKATVCSATHRLSVSKRDWDER